MKKYCIFFSALILLLFVSGCVAPESPEQPQISSGSIFSESQISSPEEQNAQSSTGEHHEPSTDTSPDSLNEFCFVTEENGKSHVLIYSPQQIQILAQKREQNEMLPLNTEQIKFIIEETISLFESNEIIQINELSGKTNTYYGLPFYKSEEYLSKFGTLQNEDVASSLDFKRSLLEVIFKRIEVLHPNIFDGFESDSKYVLVTSREISANDSNDFFNALFNVYELGSTSPSIKNALADYPIAAFFFDFNDKGIGFISDISHADPSKVEQLLPDSVLPPHVSPTKYDYNGKVVVVELYESAAQKLIARLRFDEKQDPDIISDIQVRFNQFTTNLSGSGNAEQSTNYRAVVYLNGFAFASSNDTCILYCPDGDLDLSNFSGGYNIFQHNIFFQKGCQPLTEYINELLRTNLTA